MKKVALYPYDRFTQELVIFKGLLDFTIGCIIDFEPIGSVEGIEVISDVENAFSEVDTLIVSLPKDETPSSYDKWKCVVKKASEKGIKIVCIHEQLKSELGDWIDENNINLITFVEETREQFAEYSKLMDLLASGSRLNNDEENTNLIPPKRISIYGTGNGPEQFMAQMSLVAELKNRGKKVAAMVTEPTGFLFKQPDMTMERFSLLAPPMDMPLYVTAVYEKLVNEGTEYMVFADRDNAAYSGDIMTIIWKMSFLIEQQIDFIMLTVSYDDDEIITDCLDFLRIYGNCNKLFAFLLTDRVFTSDGKIELKTEDEVEKRKTELKQKFGIDNVELISNMGKIIPSVL